MSGLSSPRTSDELDEIPSRDASFVDEAFLEKPSAAGKHANHGYRRLSRLCLAAIGHFAVIIFLGIILIILRLVYGYDQTYGVSLIESESLIAQHVVQLLIISSHERSGKISCQI